MKSRIAGAMIALIAAVPGAAGSASPPIPSVPAPIDDALSLADGFSRLTDGVPIAQAPARRALPPYRMTLECETLTRRIGENGTTREERSQIRYTDVLDRQGAVFQTGITLWPNSEVRHIKEDCVLEVGRGGPIVSMERLPTTPTGLEVWMGRGDISMGRDPKTGRWMGLGGYRMERLFVPPWGRVRHSFTFSITGPDSAGERCLSVAGSIGRPGNNPRVHGRHPDWPPPRESKDRLAESSSSTSSSTTVAGTTKVEDVEELIADLTHRRRHEQSPILGRI